MTSTNQLAWRPIDEEAKQGQVMVVLVQGSLASDGSPCFEDMQFMKWDFLANEFRFQHESPTASFYSSHVVSWAPIPQLPKKWGES